MSGLISQSKVKLSHGLLQAQARIEEPLPGGPGDDEAERHGVEVDRPEHALDADLLIQQDGQGKAD
jgi:hypothetical protein